MENELHGSDLFTLGNFLIDIDVGTDWVGASTVRRHYDGVVLLSEDTLCLAPMQSLHLSGSFGLEALY